MCAQLNLEVMSKSIKERKYHLIFMNFKVKKFTIKTTSIKKALMFECYNIVNPINDGV
jgi:hypothetical protein